MAFSPSGGVAYCAASHHQLQFPVVSCCFFAVAAVLLHLVVLGPRPCLLSLAGAFLRHYNPAWISGRIDIQFGLGNSMWGVSEVVTRVFEVPKLSHCVDS